MAAWIGRKAGWDFLSSGDILTCIPGEYNGRTGNHIEQMQRMLGTTKNNFFQLDG